MSTHQIQIKHGNQTQQINATLPNDCPICHVKIQPHVIAVQVHENKNESHMVLRCNNDDCQNFFIAYYSHKDGLRPNDYRVKYLKPQEISKRQFSLDINEISRDFINIYHEALVAESSGLEQISGAGYRKAFEFLIKDYAKSTTNDDQNDKINSMFASKVVEKYISHEKIKNMANRALWLGNDETHYLRKWKDKDISDLKRLIDLTIHWIEIEKDTERYQSEMEGSQNLTDKPRSS